MKRQLTFLMCARAGMLMIVMLCCASYVYAGSTIEGKVRGLNCVLYGKACPVDKSDPHVDGEVAFVVMTSDKNYFFLPNVHRTIMARLVEKQVRITGELVDEYRAINAEKIEVSSNHTYKVDWTQEMENRSKWRYFGHFGGVPALGAK